MATNNTFRLQSVVAKSANQPFCKPRSPQQPSKVETLEDYLSDMNDQERLTFELERFGHFTIEEGGRWTQAEIDAEWDRQYAVKLANHATTEPSPAFVLNWDFKPEPEPEYIILNDDPQPVPTSTVKPFMPVSLETPVNYWDDWRAREGIVMRHLTQAQYGQEMRQKKAAEERQKEVAERLLKKRKSDEDWGKYFYFYFKN